MLLHQATRFRVPGCLDAFSPERSGFTRPLYAIRDGRVARLDFTDPGLDALPALPRSLQDSLGGLVLVCLTAGNGP